MASTSGSESSNIPDARHRIAAITANPRDIIRLNVGGEKFTTKRSTLCQIEGSLLASMFSGRWEDGLKRDSEGCVFLDFNPKYFVLILDYLRARLVATPEHPVCLPEVDSRDAANFNSLVDYLGLADEFSTVEKCTFGIHSFGFTIEKNGTSASLTSCHEITKQNYYINNYSGVVLSKNTYSQGIIRWTLSFADHKDVFVGVVKGEPTSIRYEDIMERYLCHRNGSFGWTLGQHWQAIIDSKPCQTLRQDAGVQQITYLTLDCQRRTLEAALLNGQKFHIRLPNVTSWKLQIGLELNRGGGDYSINTSCSVNINM